MASTIWSELLGEEEKFRHVSGQWDLVSQSYRMRKGDNGVCVPSRKWPVFSLSAKPSAFQDFSLQP